MSRRVAPQRPLSERDQAVLATVGDYRFMRADQLLRLHFWSGTPAGRQRRGQATLRHLTENGYLHRLPRTVGGVGSGSGRFVYQLGYRGQKAVWPDRRARSPEDIGQQFVQHALDTAELVTRLVEAQRVGQLDDLQVETEPAVWRRYLAPSGRMVVLKPDLGIQLTTQGEQLVWFVEVDRATEGLGRIRTKASQYVDYWRSGQEQQRLGVFPRVLWSVPDERRAAALSRTVATLPDPASQMFRVATAEQAASVLRGEQQPEQTTHERR